MDLADLPPRKDPKGGSPKTPPGGIPAREYQEFSTYDPPASYHNGSGVWKMATGILATLVIGLIGMYFTALQTKGISQKEMQEYDREYSLYAKDRQVLFDRNNEQDRLIGGASAKIDKNTEDLSSIKYKMETSAEDRKAIHSKLDQVADLLQSSKK